MCGVAGVWSRDPIADPVPLAERFDRALAHRGPDGHAWTTHDAGRLMLLHRRLAIIDPSPAGGQPMSSPDGRYTIIFNGEIYNHDELRRLLEQSGEAFLTRSDTEVALRLVARCGPDALARMRGMFALAVWDADARTLLVARDRFGIKPLYVSATPARIAFASELRALHQSGVCPREVDPSGILGFLRWGAVPGHLTWLRGVRALEPGTWIRWSADFSTTCGQFADVRTLWSSGAAIAEGELREHARHALQQSVRAHLVADVPVGFFLSGGIDSGALVSIAAAQRQRLHTFTVAFDDEQSEERLAQLVSAQCGTEHHTLHVDSNRVLSAWPSILEHMDQPTIDGINSYLVSSAVAATGVKAIVSGIGGDEAFGGYPSFRRIPRGARLSVVPRKLRAAGTRLVSQSSTSWRAQKLQHAAEHADDTFELYRAVRGWMMPAELMAISGPRLRDRSLAERVDEVESQLAAAPSDAGVHATIARLESTMYMRQQLLRDADVMSMAHGLEVRVPLVDHELIGAVWPALGQHPALLRGKRLLAESLPTPLPAAITSRPKQGFTLPFARWIDGPLAEFVTAGLATAAREGWLSPDAPSAIAEAWKARACHWSRPWGLAVLGHFLNG
jgi:asparagine synthase (glutamine-hydrolysing)